MKTKTVSPVALRETRHLTGIYVEIYHKQNKAELTFQYEDKSAGNLNNGTGLTYSTYEVEIQRAMKTVDRLVNRRGLQPSIRYYCPPVYKVIRTEFSFHL